MVFLIMAYFFRYKSFSFETVPGDTKFTLAAYLADAYGTPFLLSGGSLDTFNVATFKSSLPPVNYKDYWVQLSQQAIASHYEQTSTGKSVQTSNVIEGLESTENLIPGMLLISTVFPEGTVINTVRDATSLIMSQVATSTATEASFSFSTSSWFVNYDSLDLLIDYINFGNF